MKQVKHAARMLITALFGVAVGAAASENLPRQTPMTLSIPSQPVADSLAVFARQTGLSIMFKAGLGTSAMAPALNGQYRLDEALTLLLTGSELTYRFVDDNTVAIRVLRPVPAADAKAFVGTGSERRLAQSKDSSLKAQEGSEDDGETESSVSENKISNKEISEIIVTAQKRSERLQDVPVPVKVIQAETLVENNQTRLQDYYTKVAGLNLTTFGDIGVPLIAIRGITTGGFVNPTAGIMVDDIPFGASTIGGGNTAPDFDPSELARIEVLRGPQGTLYGASSIGGLIKYVTVDPSTEQLSARLQVGTTTVRHSDDLGHSILGAVNVPLSDSFAVRASASTRRDPGYIDNIQTGHEDINSTETTTARLAALWRPSDNFTLKLSALYQRAERAGASDIHLSNPLAPGLQGFQQSALINTGTFDRRFQAYSATMTGRLAGAELTSLTGYGVLDARSALDVGPNAGGLISALALQLHGVSGADQVSHSRVEKFTQEVRASIPIGSRIEWLIGGFYTNEDYPFAQNFRAINPATGAVREGTWAFADDGTGASFSEYAVFTNLTIQLTDRFDVQLGARQSDATIRTAGSVTTAFAAPFVSSVTPEFKASNTPFTYLLTPRFRISPDLMIYGRLASGYRPGGVNAFAFGTPIGVPTEFGSDTTINYELGMKVSLFDRMLTFDGSIYYIDWKDVQIQLRDQIPPSGIFQTYTLNAGRAKSEGVELSLELKPVKGLTITAWGAYNNARLTEVPANGLLAGFIGARLPYSSPWSGNLSIDQEFEISAAATGFVGGSVAYVDDRKGRYFPGQTQVVFPRYTPVDLHAGVKLDTWKLNLFVNNATDAKGVLRGGRDNSLSLPYAITYTQPRTFGLALAHDF